MALWKVGASSCHAIRWWWWCDGWVWERDHRPCANCAEAMTINTRSGEDSDMLQRQEHFELLRECCSGANGACRSARERAADASYALGIASEQHSPLELRAPSPRSCIPFEVSHLAQCSDRSRRSHVNKHTGRDSSMDLFRSRSYPIKIAIAPFASEGRSETAIRTRGRHGSSNSCVACSANSTELVWLSKRPQAWFLLKRACLPSQKSRAPSTPPRQQIS